MANATTCQHKFILNNRVVHCAGKTDDLVLQTKNRVPHPRQVTGEQFNTMASSRHSHIGRHVCVHYRRRKVTIQESGGNSPGIWENISETVSPIIQISDGVVCMCLHCIIIICLLTKNLSKHLVSKQLGHCLKTSGQPCIHHVQALYHSYYVGIGEKWRTLRRTPRREIGRTFKSTHNYYCHLRNCMCFTQKLIKEILITAKPQNETFSFLTLNRHRQIFFVLIKSVCNSALTSSLL